MIPNYPYDPEANLPSNRVTEALSTYRYPNKYNVVVPLTAPFYRLDLEVRDADDRLLIEGLDYYLGYYYSAAAKATGKAVYGGIMLPSNDNVTVKLRSLGGNHMVPDSEIGRFLTDPEIDEPRNIDFEKLHRYPVVVDPIDKPENIEEAIEKDKVVSALNDLNVLMSDTTDKLDDKFKVMIDTIAALALKIHGHDLLVHHKTPSQHMYTRAELGVLGETETAINSIKAYGMNITEVVNEMLTFGINERRVDGLLKQTLSRVVRGLIMADLTGITFKNSDYPDSQLKLTGYGMVIGSEGELAFEADVDFLNAGIGIEIGAGLNVLLIPSAGSVKGGKPSFNGRALITTDSVMEYLYPPTTTEVSVVTSNTDTVEIYGRGNSVSPLSFQATPPIASVTLSGLFSLTNSPNATASNIGISQYTLTMIKDALDTYVDKSFTVNGEEFGSDEAVVVTKEQMGLELVDNTYPEDKPVSNALTASLADKAKETHTHSTADLLNIPNATSTVEGIAMLHDAIDATRSKAVTAKQGLALKDYIDGVEADVDGRVKVGVASATHFGGSGYLPVPVLGNYGHANYSYPGFYGEEDRNGKFVVLLNLASHFGRGVFYQEIQMADSGGVVSHNKTSVEYAPKFITDLGRKVRYVFGGYNGLFSIQDDTGVNWLVTTYGTMDMSKHYGHVQTGPAGQSVQLFVHGNSIYRTQIVTGMNTYFYLYRTDHQTYLNGGEMVWETLTLSGNDMYGNRISTTNPKFAPIDMSTDPNAQSMLWRNDGGKWTHIGPRHSVQNWDIGIEGNELVLYAYQKAYCSNAYTQSYGTSDQVTSLSIDLSTYEFVIADPHLLKQTVNESGVISQDPHGLMRWPGIEPNSTSYRIKGKKFCFHARWYGTHSAPYVYIAARGDNSDVDLCRRKMVPGYINISGASINGPTPSVIQSVRSMPSWKDDNTIVYRDLITGVNECKVNVDVPYTGFSGLGPTSDRKTLTGDYTHVYRIPRVWIAGQVRNEGFTGNPGSTLPTKMSESWTPLNIRTFDSVNGNALLDTIKNEMLARGETTTGRYINGNICLSVFGSPSAPLGAFITYAFRHYVTDAHEQSYARYVLYKVDVTVSGDKILVSSSGRELIYTRVVIGNCTGLNNGMSEAPQSMCYRTEEGILGFALHNNPYASWVGNGGRVDINVEKNADGTFWERTETHYAYQFSSLWGWHPKFGFYDYGQSASGDAILGYPAGFKSADIRAGVNTGTIILLATTAEEGWIVYFTQPLAFYCEQVLYTVPVADFDLRVLFPTNYRNNTFYIHIELVSGVPVYVFGEAILPDTDTRLWVGHVTTDSERIVDLVVDRAKRLGNVATLLQHNHNKFAHGYDATDTLSGSEYVLLENKGMLHEAEILTSKDIFDVWYRYSHGANGNYPSDPADVNSWRYIEAYDCVECTKNTNTFIGFVSDKKAGDFEFNTIVTSDNGDDDGICIVLAAHKQGDYDSREHTLSLVMTRGGVNGSYIRLMDNFYQTSTAVLRVIDPRTQTPNNGDGGWSRWFGHVYATRVKSILTMYTIQVLLPTPSAGQTVDEMIEAIVAERADWVVNDFRREGYFETIIDLAQEAPKYNRPTRFGYGSASQLNARFWNIERPLSDFSEFYSSEQLLRSTIDENKGKVRKFNGTMAVPAGFRFVLEGSVDSDAGQRMVAYANPASNYQHLTWDMAAITPYTTSIAGTTSKCIAPTSGFRPPSGVAFYVRKVLTFTTTTMYVQALADDAFELWVDNTKVTVPSNTKIGIAITPGEHVITFKVTEIPNLTPCYITFGIWDGPTSLLSQSDATWPCALPNDYRVTTLNITKLSYLVEAGNTDTFTAASSAAGIKTAGVCLEEEELLPDGKTQVTKYIDVTGMSTINWDVTISKNNVI